MYWVFKRLPKVLFIIYVAFESIFKPATNDRSHGPNTEKYQDNIDYRYCYMSDVLVNNLRTQ